MAGGTVRADRVSATRELILAAAERLFAEHGVLAVSNRQVSEAAGQGNNAAVGYHCGTKADLVRAIVRKHTEQIDRLRVERLTKVSASDDLRHWVTCLVRPTADHLAALGNPTWFGRFTAQVMTDPAFREIMETESLDTLSLRQVLHGLERCASPSCRPRCELSATT